MCLIMVQNSDLNLSRKEFFHIGTENPHGTGMMWSDGKKLHIKKFLKLQEAWKCYEKVVTLSRKGPLIVHWRWATHGNRDLANCHPYLADNKEVAIAHNGILSTEDVHGMSDTRVWIDTVLWGRDRKSIMDKDFCEHQEEYLGNSKLVFLDRFGNFRILNEWMGVWSGSDWYSNNCLWETKGKCHIPVNGNSITGYTRQTEADLDDDDNWEESPWQREVREQREARQEMLDYVRGFTDNDDDVKKK